MKKIASCTAAFLMLTMVVAQPKTVYLNSKTVTCNSYGVKKECLQYKNNLKGTAWNVYSSTIRGFTYNPGFFYTLQVQQLQSNIPQWKLVKVISKTKSTIQQQPGDSLIHTARPPATLAGQWNFTRMLSGTAAITFTPEKEFLRFDATELKITGRASCNSFFSNYTVDSLHQIKFEAIGHTMMACEAMDTETKMMQALEAVTNWTVTGNTLYLKAGDKTLIELTRAAGGKL